MAKRRQGSQDLINDYNAALQQVVDLKAELDREKRKNQGLIAILEYLAENVKGEDQCLDDQRHLNQQQQGAG